VSTRPVREGRRRSGRGQGVVEFAILVPAFMIVLFGMLEFGFAFSHHLTLEYATREGARVGAALGSGTNELPLPCALPPPEDVDELIIAAVQRVITSPGSQIPLAQVKWIHIYKANANGGETAGFVNVWGPGRDGKEVDFVPLEFRPTAQPWSACSRKALTAGSNPDSIGVSLAYDYDAITPLGTILNITGDGTLRITDRTVMAVQPFVDG
jgi:TadE-like protein